MFSRFKKPEPGAAKPAPNLAPVGAAQAAPRATATTATAKPAAPGLAAARAAPRSPAEVAQADKDRKRKERLQDLKVELHKRLLENLNLAVLEKASEANLKAEIAAISAEAWMKCRSR